MKTVSLKKCIAISALTLTSTLALADDIVVPNVFEAGTPAIAADVNENFETIAAEANEKFSAMETALANSLAALPMSVGYSNVPGGVRDSLTNVTINGGSIVAPLAPGSEFTIEADVAFSNADSCPSCIIQIRAGIVGEPDVGCLADGIPATAPEETSVSGSVTLTAPTEPGIYLLSYDRTAEFSCITTRTDDPSDHLMGFIVVQ